MIRPSQRKNDQMREIEIQKNYTMHAEGSVLISFGNTKVLCTASIENKVPVWLRGSNKGWVTAEYGMLPRSTGSRMHREATRGKQSGRTMEIQRLIARSLRTAVNLKALSEHMITVDCDVIQADGGTRTASITGAYIALHDACQHLLKNKLIKENPIIHSVAAISVGIYKNEVILDLDYAEDSTAETDMNIVMNADGHFIEIQGTAEGKAFQNNELQQMLQYAQKGIQELTHKQQQVLNP